MSSIFLLKSSEFHQHPQDNEINVSVWGKHTVKEKKSMQHYMVSVTLFLCSPIVHRWNKQRILDFWSALQISGHFVALYLIPGGLTVVPYFKSTILQLLLASSVTINRNTLFCLTLCSLKLKKTHSKSRIRGSWGMDIFTSVLCMVKDKKWNYLPRIQSQSPEEYQNLRHSCSAGCLQYLVGTEPRAIKSKQLTFLHCKSFKYSVVAWQAHAQPESFLIDWCNCSCF